MGERTTDLDGLLARVHHTPRERLPRGWASEAGDCYFYFTEDVPYTRLRVDELVTLYEADDTQRLVGLEIKSLGKLRELLRHELGNGMKFVDVSEMLLRVYKVMRPSPKPTEEERERKVEKSYFRACINFVGSRAAIFI
jgi:hypothetical protein